jgi:Tol biopolymer transport system component
MRKAGLGGPDIWSARRASVSDPWSAPVNLGLNVNSASGEARPSLSRDGKRLYFGSPRDGGEGNSDIYVATRP